MNHVNNDKPHARMHIHTQIYTNIYIYAHTSCLASLISSALANLSSQDTVSSLMSFCDCSEEMAEENSKEALDGMSGMDSAGYVPNVLTSTRSPFTVLARVLPRRALRAARGEAKVWHSEQGKHENKEMKKKAKKRKNEVTVEDGTKKTPQ